MDVEVVPVDDQAGEHKDANKLKKCDTPEVLEVEGFLTNVKEIIGERDATQSKNTDEQGVEYPVQSGP